MHDVPAGFRTTYCPPRRAPRPTAHPLRAVAMLAVLALLAAWRLQAG